MTFNKGILFAIASALLFGISTPFTKLFISGSENVFIIGGLLYLGSGIGLSLYLLLISGIGKAHSEENIGRQDIPILSLTSLCGGIIAPIFLLFGLTQTDATSASLMLNFEGLATLIIAAIIFKEHLDKKVIWGSLIILLGGIILVFKNGAKIDFGALYIIIACIFWGIDNNLTRSIAGRNPIQITAFKGIIAGFVNFFIGFTLPSSSIQIETLIFIPIIGLFSYGISLVFFVLALRELGSARAGSYFATAPFIGALVSVIFFDISLNWQLVLSGALMALGIYLHLIEDHSHEHTHEEIEHSHSHFHDEHHNHSHEGIEIKEPHTHSHRHEKLSHSHFHFPDIHHRHEH
jgi:drug/metabolite transporter (DMT)-like permease